MSRYLKSITALFTGVVGWGAFVVASPSAAVTAPEWIMLAVAVGTALGVYAIPNQSPPRLPLAEKIKLLTDVAAPTTTTAAVSWSEPAAKPPPPVKPVKKTAPKKGPTR